MNGLRPHFSPSSLERLQWSVKRPWAIVWAKHEFEPPLAGTKEVVGVGEKCSLDSFFWYLLFLHQGRKKRVHYTNLNSLHPDRWTPCPLLWSRWRTRTSNNLYPFCGSLSSIVLYCIAAFGHCAIEKNGFTQPAIIKWEREPSSNSPKVCSNFFLPLNSAVRTRL